MTDLYLHMLRRNWHPFLRSLETLAAPPQRALFSKTSDRAQLRVRGLGQDEQGLKASVDPSESEVQEMVETVLTPAHPDPLEPLLNKPFARTLDHPTAQRQAQFLVHGIVDVLAVPFQGGIHRAQSVSGCCRQPLDVQGVRQVGQDPVRPAMP